MKGCAVLIYILIILYMIMCLFGGGLFLLNFFGNTYDDITGTHDYFMWSFS